MWHLWEPLCREVVVLLNHTVCFHCVFNSSKTKFSSAVLQCPCILSQGKCTTQQHSCSFSMKICVVMDGIVVLFVCVCVSFSFSFVFWLLLKSYPLNSYLNGNSKLSFPVDEMVDLELASAYIFFLV